MKIIVSVISIIAILISYFGGHTDSLILWCTVLIIFNQD